MGEKGMLFSLDAAIACMIMLTALLITIAWLGGAAGREIARAEEFEREHFAAALAEAIVKNRDEADPSRGAAYFSAEKNRVEANVLDEALLRKISGRKFGKYSLVAAYERGGGEKKYYFGDGARGCIVVERFAVIKGATERKAILGVEVCG